MQHIVVTLSPSERESLVSEIVQRVLDGLGVSDESGDDSEDLNLLTVSQLSDLLSVSKKTIYRYVELGKIPYRKVGKNYRFSLAEVEASLPKYRRGRKVSV